MANLANVSFPPNFGIGNPLNAVERAHRSVFVGNIPYEATEEQLKEIFTQAGPVTSFRLVYDRETGKPKGYGFCEYQDVETAQSAMRNLNNHDFNGRPLRVGVAAGDQKDDNKSMQQAVGGPVLESPFGDSVESSKAPEVISKAVASLPPEQMFELMKQMKMCIQNNPNEARNMLLQNPQLAYALLQAQIVMKIVDPQVALAMLHRETEQIPPLLPSGSAAAEPANNTPAPMMTSPGMGMPPSQSGASSHMGNPMQGNAQQQQQQQQLPGLDYRHDVDVRGGMMGDNPNRPGQNVMPSQHMEHLDMHMGGNRGGPPFMENRGPRGPTPQHDIGPNMGPMHDMGQGRGPGSRPDMGPMHDMGPSRGPGSRPDMGPNMGGPMHDMGQGRGPGSRPDMGPNMGGSMHDMGQSRGPGSRPDMGPMHGMGGPRGPGPRNDMGRMHDMGPRGPGPRQDVGPMRDMGGPRGPHPRGPRPDQPDTRGAPGGGDRGRGPVPRQTSPQVGASLPSGGIPGLTGDTPISSQDHEKAALIMQVLQLSDEQIAMLPLDQRQSILILKEQIARSGHAPT